MNPSLNRGQTVRLQPDGGGTLTRVRMGLGWDSIKKLGPLGRIDEVGVDLDASALLVTADKQVLEIVYFGHLSNVEGSMQHTGDNLTGQGEGDDESIIVDLAGVSDSVEHIVFVVTSYSGHSFTEIDNATARIVDLADADRELARYTLNDTGDHTAVVMARISRAIGGWTFTAIGSPGNGRTVRDLVPLALSLL